MMVNMLKFFVIISRVKMSLTKFLSSGNLPGNVLEIQIIRALENGYFVVGDTSGLALLSTLENPHLEKDLVIGRTVKLIKPEIVDQQKIQCNKTFKPMPSKKPLKITVSENDISKLKINTEINPIPYGISIPAMLGVIDSNFFIHTNKTMSN